MALSQYGRVTSGSIDWTAFSTLKKANFQVSETDTISSSFLFLQGIYSSCRTCSSREVRRGKACLGWIFSIFLQPQVQREVQNPDFKVFWIPTLENYFTSKKSGQRSPPHELTMPLHQCSSKVGTCGDCPWMQRHQELIHSASVLLIRYHGVDGVHRVRVAQSFLGWIRAKNMSRFGGWSNLAAQKEKKFPKRCLLLFLHKFVHKKFAVVLATSFHRLCCLAFQKLQQNVTYLSFAWFLSVFWRSPRSPVCRVAPNGPEKLSALALVAWHVSLKNTPTFEHMFWTRSLSFIFFSSCSRDKQGVNSRRPCFRPASSVLSRMVSLSQTFACASKIARPKVTKRKANLNILQEVFFNLQFCRSFSRCNCSENKVVLLWKYVYISSFCSLFYRGMTISHSDKFDSWPFLAKLRFCLYINIVMQHVSFSRMLSIFKFTQTL